MASDTPVLVTVRDGLGNTFQTTATSDGANPPDITLQHPLRTNGGPVEAGNPLPTFTPPTPFVGSGSVNTSATEGEPAILILANPARRGVYIFNRSATIGVNAPTIDIGPSGVTVGGGIPLGAGGGGVSLFGLGAAGDIYAVCPSASVPCSYVEV